MQITKLKLQKIIQEELDIILQELEEEGPFGSSQPMKRAEAESTKEIATTGRIPPSEESEAALKRAAKRAAKKITPVTRRRPAEKAVQKHQGVWTLDEPPPEIIRRRRHAESTPGDTVYRVAGPDTAPGI